MDDVSWVDVSYLVCFRCGFWYLLRPVPVSFHLVRFSHVDDRLHEVEYDEDASRSRRIDGRLAIRRERVRGRIETRRPLIVPARFRTWKGNGQQS